MISILVILAPLVLAVAMFPGLGPRRIRAALLPIAPLPALAFAIWGDPKGAVTVDWLLLGGHLGVVYSGPGFLFFTALLWVIAGWYAAHYVLHGWKERGRAGDGAAQVGARSSERRFCFFWLLSLAGNLGLVLAGDIPTFYTSFAFMTFSAYGLVISTESAEARRASRVYLVLAVIGEGMLIGAFLLAVAPADSFLLSEAAAAVAGSPHRDLILLLAIAGFGVKAGMVPLHFWLPLAHPVAPTPASAVLSGVMIKAGLLGWMYLLPGGFGAFPGWSVGLCVLGLIAAFYGVACGLCQRALKTILAYSSVSQMGLMLFVVGAGLADARAWSAILVVLVVFAMNHAFAKGALFLGTGMCRHPIAATSSGRRWILFGLAVPALAIAGAPMMGGAIAKEAVKVATEVPAETAPWLRVLLPLASVATTILLGRFLWLARDEMRGNTKPQSIPPGVNQTGLMFAWVLAVAAAMFGVHFAIPWYALELQTAEPTWWGLWESVWPILVGGIFVFAAGSVLRRRMRIAVPAGDIVAVIEAIFRWIHRRLDWLVSPERWRINFYPTIERWAQGATLQRSMARAEAFFRRKETAGFFMMLFIWLVWLLLRAG